LARKTTGVAYKGLIQYISQTDALSDLSERLHHITQQTRIYVSVSKSATLDTGLLFGTANRNIFNTLDGGRNFSSPLLAGAPSKACHHETLGRLYMTENYPSTKQSTYKFLRNLPMRTVIALLIAPGLSLVFFSVFDNVIGIHNHPWLNFGINMFLAYIMLLPFIVPCFIILRAFCITSAALYVVLGMLAGRLNYWLFFGCYKAYKYYHDGKMSFYQAFQHSWDKDDHIFLLVEVVFWGVTGFVFWLIAVRRWPAFARPSSQDKQGSQNPPAR
jgi:hypothetical protein